MARRRIYLMRHGEVSYVGSEHGWDPPLNESGQRQAEATRALLAQVELDAVVATGLTRTIQTAEIVRGDRDLEIEIVDGLREASTGDFAGIDGPEAMEQLIKGAFQNAESPDARFMTGETYQQLWERVHEHWQHLIHRRDWTHLLLVAHGVVNRVILAQAFGVGREIFRRIEQDPGCLNIIDIDDLSATESRPAYVRLMNFTARRPAKEGLYKTTMEQLWDQFMVG